MSILHFEDLPPRKLIEVLDNFWDYEATEKLDGSQLLFGIDEDGFYTSRETKGGMRIYNVDDYELSFKNTYIRSAHIALERSLTLLKDAGLKTGCQVEIEVLYGELPNVVQYSRDMSFIIFLRTTGGHVNIDDMRVKLENRTLTVPLVAPFTFNGKDILYRLVTNEWKFSQAPKITLCDQVRDHFDFYHRLVDSIMFLHDPKTDLDFVDILETPLNKKPAWLGEWNWPDVREYLTDTKQYIKFFLDERIVPFKELLLDTLVRSRSSMFGPKNGWIEGIVFRHPITGHMFKIVDKDVFLTIKDFCWRERANLFSIADIDESTLITKLDKYEKEKDDYCLKVVRPMQGSAIICKYDNELDQRTREIYATLFQQIKLAKQGL